MDRHRRSFWLRLHRWLGLALGPLFLLLGLTGSLLVFYTEFDRATTPPLAAVAADVPVHSWQRVLQGLEAAHPARDRGWRIELPPDGRGLVTARYLKPAESSGAFFAPLVVSVHPHSGQVLASRLWGDFFSTWVYDLHYTGLAGETGRTVVGALGVLMAASLVAGTVLWWPRRGQWRAALRLKLGGSSQRRHYDLHKLMGLAGGLWLLLLALTGLALAWPQWVNPLVQGLNAGTHQPMPSVQGARQPGLALLPLDTVLQQARRHWPDSQARWVDTPAAGSAVFRVRLWRPGSPSQRFPHHYLWLDGTAARCWPPTARRTRGQAPS